MQRRPSELVVAAVEVTTVLEQAVFDEWLAKLEAAELLPLTPRRRASITWSRRWSACPLRWSPCRGLCPLRMIIRARRINWS